MKYYLIDDDINILKILEGIIEENFKRTVVGASSDPVSGIQEIQKCTPDIVILDYLMPHKDGSDVIKEIRKFNDQIQFIMISQVSDKKMVAEAYSSGLSFFIQKPINKIEVNVVLDNVEERIHTNAKLKQIYDVFGGWKKPEETADSEMDRVKCILRDLGIYSEKGTKDVLKIIEIYYHENTGTVNDAFIKYADTLFEEPKIIRQRIRRAIAKALRNIAFLGIEDNLNEVYQKYSVQLFDFETVKLEMDNIRGKRHEKGTISTERFIESLIELERL